MTYKVTYNVEDWKTKSDPDCIVIIDVENANGSNDIKFINFGKENRFETTLDALIFAVEKTLDLKFEG